MTSSGKFTAPCSAVSQAMGISVSKPSEEEPEKLKVIPIRAVLCDSACSDCPNGVVASGSVRMSDLTATLLPVSSAGCSVSRWHQVFSVVRSWHRAFLATTDVAFIRSEINGRRSRRIVLFAFFCADAVGGGLWAFWCENGAPGNGPTDTEHAEACRSFGVNHYLLWGTGIPLEGLVLFLAGRDPWSFWSDAWLLPVWMVRLGLLDVLLWNVPPQILVGDALWFSVIAVMCRVHSLVLWILVAFEVASLMLALGEGGLVDIFAFDHVRYGMYSVAMLIIMAGAYFLDEQTRLQSFGQVMSLQDQNAALAEMMLRWKVLPDLEQNSSLGDGQEDASVGSIGSSSSALRHGAVRRPDTTLSDLSGEWVRE
eukprot:s2161_g4.t2